MQEEATYKHHRVRDKLNLSRKLLMLGVRDARQIQVISRRDVVPRN